jgi:hypothetical protein
VTDSRAHSQQRAKVDEHPTRFQNQKHSLKIGQHVACRVEKEAAHHGVPRTLLAIALEKVSRGHAYERTPKCVR